MGGTTVSIIIPVYNAAAWLQDTLDSSLAQTWHDIEIIVVDDGSTDDSLEIARGNESERLAVLSQQNRGAAAARNAGLGIARGDFIQFLDADDLLDPRKIEVQVEKLMNSGSGCIASGSWAMFSSSIDGVTMFPEPLWRDMAPVEWTCALFTRKGMMPIHAWLFSRPIVELAGQWDESLTLNDDREFSTRLALASKGIVHCTDSLSYYRITGHESLSRIRSTAAWESAYNVTALNADHLLAVQDDPVTRSACATELAGFAIIAYDQHPELAERALTRIRELGVENYQIPFNGLFERAARVFGCEKALKIRRTFKWMWK